MNEKPKVRKGKDTIGGGDLNSGFSDFTAQALTTLYWFSSVCKSGTSRKVNQAIDPATTTHSV